ncbi:hypothetical protein FOA52_002299 [Chlamydomonas sp. UWO 241]|nr:hypothetical protein FOA52_002299 [Chlamydomonas sp. UWO 241]
MFDALSATGAWLLTMLAPALMLCAASMTALGDVPGLGVLLVFAAAWALAGIAVKGVQAVLRAHLGY